MLFSEPKIPQFKPNRRSTLDCLDAFQCSSASRKFLNIWSGSRRVVCGEVSVLFSEPKIPQSTECRKRASIAGVVSVLFSEPKIPQSIARIKFPKLNRVVSVLFSEPKIPQLVKCSHSNRFTTEKFQCSSASRKFLNFGGCIRFVLGFLFQCSSASRKFLNW